MTTTPQRPRFSVFKNIVGLWVVLRQSDQRIIARFTTYDDAIEHAQSGPNIAANL